MNKKLLLIFMLLFVCVKAPAIFAKPEKKVQKTSYAKKVKKNRCKKMTGLAQQLSVLRVEIDTLEKGSSKETVAKLNHWIDHLQGEVLAKLKHEEEKLQKYRFKMDELPVSEESYSRILEKIQNCESSIQTHQECIKIIDQLKVKIVEKSKSDA